MKFYAKALLTMCIGWMSIVSSIAQTTNPGYKLIKTSNGQTYLISSANVAGGMVETGVYFRMGAAYEFDSINGVTLTVSKIIDRHILSQLKSNPEKRIKYRMQIGSDMVSFHLTHEWQDMDYVLGLVNNKVMTPTFDETDLEVAKEKIKAELDSIAADGQTAFELGVQRKLWAYDFKKITQYGDGQTYDRLKVSDLRAFHTKYFLPTNNTITVLGSINENDAINKLQNVFRDFHSNEYNPELINRLLDFKPLIYQTQMICKQEGMNTAAVYFQAPGARQGRKDSYAAFVLCGMINNKFGRIQRSFREAGLKDLQAIYDCHNHYGTFKISASSDKNNFTEMFKQLKGLVTTLVQKDNLKQGDLEVTEKNIGIEINDLKNSDYKDYLSRVVSYRFSNDENYFVSLGDSIARVTVEDMQRYLGEYFTENSGISVLYTSADRLRNPTDSNQYYELDESIGNIKCYYELNKTDVERDSDKVNILRLIQWMNINPDIHLQVNGFSDEGEFKKTDDEVVMKFIDSIPTFKKAMPDYFGKKHYLRIEMMRAMKIIKQLYEAGIPENKITGTSMTFKSDSKEAQAENRKCTFTLEKVKPRVSLYEYHFGKKKEGTE